MLPILKRDALRMAVDLCSETGDPALVLSVAEDFLAWIIGDETDVQLVPAEGTPESELN